MLRLAIRFVPLSLLVLLAACGSPGGTPPPPPGSGATLVNDRVSVLDQGARNSVGGFTLDHASGRGELRIRADDPMAGGLQAGDVLVSSPIAGIAPDGFLQRVVSTQRQGQEVVVQTEQATLTDVFDQAKIRYQQDLGPNDVVSVKSAYAGVSFRHDDPDLPQPLAGTSFDFGIDFDEVLVDVDGNPGTTDDQLTLDGSFDFNASASADIDIGWFADLDRFTFLVALDESVNLQVRGDLSEQFDESVEVARYNFGSFTVMVGPVPVVFSIDLALEVGCQGQLTAHIETGATQATSVQVGAEYKNDHWRNLSTANSTFTYTAPTFTASADARAYARPSLDIMVYGLAGPYAYAEAFIEGNSELYRDPFWQLTGGLGFGIGFRVELPIVGQVADWSTELVGVERTLQSSQDAPPELVVVSPPDGSTLLDGEALRIVAKATDREQRDVDVSLSDAAGTIDSAVSTEGASASLESDALCIGSHDFIVSAEDGAHHTVQEPLTVVVENHVPEVSIRDDLLGAKQVYPGGYLVAFADASDTTCQGKGNAADPSLVEWYVDGVKVGTTDALVIATPAGYDVGDSFALEARYDDGHDVGTSDPVQIAVVARPAGGDLAPEVMIAAPEPGENYTLLYDCVGFTSGSPLVGLGIDPEEGVLPDADLTWRFDGSFLANGARPSVTFCEPYGGDHGPTTGDHLLSLSATDGAGHEVDTELTIRISYIGLMPWP